MPASPRPVKDREVAMSRPEQIEWIKELAANLVSWVEDFDAEVEEIVKYARSEEGTRSMNIEWPEWFDEYDRSFLEDCVRTELW